MLPSEYPPDTGEIENKSYADYENSTYTVVSKVAYLIGVEKRHFENEHEPPKLEWYNQLNVDKNARIVRNLCLLRTALERHRKEIHQRMRYGLASLYTMPDLIPQSCLTELMNDGISIYKSNCRLIQYVIDINRHISDRINNCKALFPIWLKWEYIRALFIMPNGLSEAGVRAAASEYFINRRSIPIRSISTGPARLPGIFSTPTRNLCGCYTRPMRITSRI